MCENPAPNAQRSRRRRAAPISHVQYSLRRASDITHDVHRRQSQELRREIVCRKHWPIVLRARDSVRSRIAERDRDRKRLERLIGVLTREVVVLAPPDDPGSQADSGRQLALEPSGDFIDKGQLESGIQRFRRACRRV